MHATERDVHKIIDCMFSAEKYMYIHVYIYGIYMYIKLLILCPFKESLKLEVKERIKEQGARDDFQAFLLYKTMRECTPFSPCFCQVTIIT